MKWRRCGNWRWMLALAALPLAMTCSASAEDSEASISAQPTAKSARAPSAGSAKGDANLDLTRLNRKKASAGRVDLFSARSIYPAPPAPPPPPPVTPSAPQLPFRYMGKLVDGDAVTLFLAIQNQDYSVSLNGVLNNTYRVDQINDDSVVFTYLPLNTQQTLHTGRPE